MIINILDSSIYNRISAGEVIERPSSIVKELIDNSLDAGATQISIEIKEGGIKNIEVIDNGTGIPKNELHKSILPHATSKISKADDIFNVSTLGFRGEALASIAAISEFEIKTKYHLEQYGSKLYFEKGKLNIVDLAWESGTAVIVNNLFYNTPARFKFLNSRTSEENSIKKVVSQYILSNPHISFKLTSNSKIIYNTKGIDMIEALTTVFDDDIACNLLPIVESSNKLNNYKVTGFISPPFLFKHNKTFQTIIVNGRVIVDNSISATVQNAYGDRLMKKSFPIFVLDIVLPFDEVDVNVHPAKKEIRLAYSKKLLSEIYHSIQGTLLDFELETQASLFKNPFDLATQKQNKNDEPTSITQNKDTCYPNNINVEKSFDSLKKSFDNNCSDISQMQQDLFSNEIINYNLQTYDINENNDILVDSFVDGNENLSKNEYLQIDSNDFFEKNQNSSIINSMPNNAQKFYYKVIGQIFDTYLIVESKDKVFFIDQHATHESILFDKYNEELSKGKIASQQMLIPFLYECTFKDYESLLSEIKSLETLGFILEDMGPGVIKISAIPSIFSGKMDLNMLFNDICKLYNSGTSTVSLQMLDKDKIASLACKAAIKGNTFLSEESIRYVIEYFFNNDMPLQCPHGRPTMIIYTKYDFEKEFKRKV